MIITNKPQKIIIHCSATADSKSVSWQAIRKYHYSLGWNNIGYHFGIELVKNDYEILLGRMMEKRGAHCSDQWMNTKSIGVCFIGNFDKIAPPERQWEVGVNLVASLCHMLNLQSVDIEGHRKYNVNKTCPGRMFDMGKFRGEVEEKLKQ